MIDTFIQGIPCTVELDYCKGYTGESEGGQKLEPDESPHFEIKNIYQRGGKGRHLAWLESKMTDEDRERINREAKEA